MKFLHSFVLLFSIGIFLFLGSCADKSEVVGPVNNPEEHVPDVVEQITVTGSFRSVKGVMDKLSCYTSNGGYIKTAEGKTVAVSFKDSENVSSCDKITVTGFMTSRNIESNGSCPAGMMGFLKVQSYIVGETDY